MAVQQFQVGIKALIRNNNGEVLLLHIPKWSGNEAHWDLPGGRIDEGENFIQTLKREIKEELGVTFEKPPKQLTALLTNITIPEGDRRLPLIFVIFEVYLDPNTKVHLDPSGIEDNLMWFTPKAAAEHMTYKFTPEFCDLVRGLN